ncbi:hypothetical protein QL093DRAFT_2447967 [Fusarium oxysporum]|nr:hypothetical protein QL093DRAFT_2447967 [Fusarium oxysporum]
MTHSLIKLWRCAFPYLQDKPLTHPSYLAVEIGFLFGSFLLFGSSTRSAKRRLTSLGAESPARVKMTEPHTVVILGASIGGLPIAHYLMKHSVPAMKTLKVVLVSPNKDFFWCLASVRGILPNMLPEDKLFYPIAPLFEKYPEDQFEFVVGKAEQLSPVKILSWHALLVRC